MLLCLLGKHKCNNLIIEGILAENNAIMTERDYTEALKAEFDTEINLE